MLDLTDSEGARQGDEARMLIKVCREALAGLERWEKAYRSTEELGSIWYGTITRLDKGEMLMRTNAANLVLQDTIERIFVDNLYADVKRGIYLVRGENVLLLGEIVRGAEVKCKGGEFSVLTILAPGSR